MWNATSMLRRGELHHGYRQPAKPERQEGYWACSKRRYRFALALGAMLFAGVANAQYGQPQYGQPQYGQYPLLDAAANQVIQKYQNSSCEQLWQQRGQPRSEREQEAVNFLRNDP